MSEIIINATAAMARLIDADALLAEYDRVYIGAPGGARALIANAPTVDAVEAVRCKDCKHDGLTECPLCYIEQQTLCFTNHDPEFYCGKGERKDNG